MDKLIIKDIDNLAEEMQEAWDNAPIGTDICAVGFYEDMIELLNYLAEYDDLFMENIEIHEPMLEGYEKEFLIQIGDCGDIWVQPAHNGEKYVQIIDSVCYVCDDVNSMFAIRNKDNELIEVSLCDGDCANCEANIEDDYDYDSTVLPIEEGEDEVIEYEYDEDFEDMHGYSWTKDTEDGFVHESFYASDPELVKEWMKRRTS